MSESDTMFNERDRRCAAVQLMPSTYPVIRGDSDLHFEGAGNGPVVITWIGIEHL